MKKIAIFGGTFNPPHIEHINIIKNAYYEGDFEQIIVLPAHIPPHKKTTTPAYLRAEMISLAIKDLPFCKIDTMELDINEPSYTLKSLPKLKEKYGDITLIIGGDSLINFNLWYGYKQILQQVSILVAVRDNQNKEVFSAINNYKNEIPQADIKTLKFMPKSISSTEIRRKIELHENVSQYLNQDIDEFIKQNNIYSDYYQLIDKLQTFVSKETFEHIKRTVICGLNLNQFAKLPTEKVFITCLLHDCAKQLNYEKMLKYFDTEDKKLIDGLKIIDGFAPVAHQYYGAILAKKCFGINDEEILDAIRNHTTADVNMTSLDKLVYVADCIEEERHYDGVQFLRTLIKDIDICFYHTLEICYNKLLKLNRVVFPKTKDAYEYYKKDIEKTDIKANIC